MGDDQPVRPPDRAPGTAAAARRRQRLRRELLSYRTPAERQELEAILYRYDTTIEEVVAGHEPPLATAEYAAEEAWQEAWDEIVLDLTSGD